MDNFNYWNQYSTDLDSYKNRNQKVTLVICTLNEAESIQEILHWALPYADEVLVVDGHSEDRTFEIAKNCGARVIRDQRQGKGDAIRCGINGAFGEIIVFMDADFSHNPNDIPRLVTPILNDQADLVIGSRIRGGSDELHGDLNKFLRILGSYIITLGICLRFGKEITDSQNGFRAIKTQVAKDLQLKEDITTIEQEMLIKALRKNYRTLEVPTHEYKRRFGESRIKLLKVSYRYVYSWLKCLCF